MRHTFESMQWLPYPRERVFAFFANPDNLPKLMPGWQKTRIKSATLVTPPPCPHQSAQLGPGTAAGSGTTMTLTFRPFPLAPFRIKWDAEITEFVWNDHFCDVQHHGPFAFWRHCHQVSIKNRDGVDGTLVRDRVVYEMRLGLLGALVHRFGGAAKLRRIFRYRHRRTAELLAQG